MTTHAIFAQDLSRLASEAPWLQCFFAKMSPATPDFSASGEMKICKDDGAPQMVLPLELAVSTNSLRWEFDIMKSWTMPPSVQASAKLMHLDKTVFLTNLKQKRLYMLYPGVQAFISLPIPNSTFADLIVRTDQINIKREKLGRETIDGHDCIKERVIEQEPNCPTEEGLVWSAVDLQNFPVKMELHTKGSVLKFDFHDVQLVKPAVSMFEIPTNYVAFTNSKILIHYAKERIEK